MGLAIVCFEGVDWFNGELGGCWHSMAQRCSWYEAIAKIDLISDI